MRLHHLLLIALLGACSDDAPGVIADTTADTEDTSLTDGDADASADASDSIADIDGTGGDSIDDVDGSDGDDSEVGPGGTVAGTALEGVGFVWDEPLHLCSGWVEGASLAEEKARKVEVRLPVQERGSLDEAALRAARLTGVVVLRGPDAAQRFTPASEVTRVGTWQLLATGGGHSLAAEIAHELPGGAGTIYEVLGVGRAVGAPTPVVTTPESWEHRFYYAPPAEAGGEGPRSTPLVRCGGDPALEDAVSVVVGTEVGGKGWAAWLRYWRTTPGADAGSYPVWLVGHRLVLSDAPWRSFDARGHWAQTYVAEHHNFADATEVDYRRDLGVWHTRLRAPEEGADDVVRVAVRNLLSFGGVGELEVERLDPKARATVISKFEVSDPSRFPRVDANHLGRELAQSCADRRVIAAGGDAYLVQMLLCRDGGSERLVGVVPVIWGSDLSLVGARLEAVTTTGQGWEVAVGELALEILPRPDDAFEVHVRDAGGNEILGSYGEAAVLGPPELREETLRASGTDAGGGAVSFSLVRRWAGLGVGKSQLYAPVRFALTAAGRTWEVESWDKLDYENTHHNWADVLEAVAEDGAKLRWRTAFMDGIANEVSATAADGTVLLAPTALR